MKNYCPDLFQNLYIQKINENQVQLGFCCVSKLGPPEDSIDFNVKFLEDQRQHYIETNNLPHSCRQCITDEKNNSTSRRLQQLTHWPDHNFTTNNNLKLLQYNCDNICNLKCIACSSLYSSSWIDDEIRLGIAINRKIKPTKHNQLLFNFDVGNIQQIYFNGGEPLLTHDHIRVLEYISSQTDPKNIHILYNTNATILPEDNVINLWKKFASITLIASIDAINEQFEYIRYPGNWGQVSDNLKRYSEYSTVNIGVNIGVHNIMYFNDLYQFANDNNIQFNFQCDTQGKLSLTNLPTQLKNNVQDYINKAEESSTKQILLNTLESQSTPDLSWINYLYSLDQIRGNDWTKSLSRLYELDPEFFNEYKNISYKI